MNVRSMLPLLTAVTLAAASRANAQAYTGTVLYPLTTPSGFQSSAASFVGASASEVVGWGTTPNQDYEALLWTSSGVLNLNPTDLSGFDGSLALSTSGNQQVGYGANTVAGNLQALLWTGSAASAVDLNPTDLGDVLESHAYYTNGTQQVGDSYILTNVTGTGKFRSGTETDLPPEIIPLSVRA